MKIALTSWGNIISPVFDAARSLTVIEIKDKQVIRRYVEPLTPGMFCKLGKLLDGLKIDVLICGAISEIPANIIEQRGIQLMSFIGGNIENIVETYVKGKPIVPVFSMPGCGRRQRRKIRGDHSGNNMRPCDHTQR